MAILECPGCLGKGAVQIATEVVECPVCEGSSFVSGDTLSKISREELLEFPGASKLNFDEVACKCGNSELVQIGDMDWHERPSKNGQKSTRATYKAVCLECGESGEVRDVYYTKYRRGDLVEKIDEVQVSSGFIKV